MRSKTQGGSVEITVTLPRWGGTAGQQLPEHELTVVLPTYWAGFGPGMFVRTLLRAFPRGITYPGHGFGDKVWSVLAPDAAPGTDTGMPVGLDREAVVGRAVRIVHHWVERRQANPDTRHNDPRHHLRGLLACTEPQHNLHGLNGLAAEVG
jgi:hypothetical protein